MIEGISDYKEDCSSLFLNIYFEILIESWIILCENEFIRGQIIIQQMI